MKIVIILFENLIIGLLLNDALKTIKVKSELAWVKILRVVLGLLIVLSYMWQLYCTYIGEYRFAISLELILLFSLYGFSHLVKKDQQNGFLIK